jgi:hypothetical protein
VSPHPLQHELIDLQFLGFLFKGETPLPHHIQVKVVLPAINPASLECMIDGFRVERFGFGFVFPDSLDTLENLVGWQANKLLHAAIAYRRLATIEAVLNHA